MARVNLLIATHALPPLSYLIPGPLRSSLRVGTAVIAPLSGHLKLGIVVATGSEDASARETLRDAVSDLSLPKNMVELCGRISRAAAVPLSVVLRAALPPGLNTSRYLMLDPAPGWPWDRGEFAGRTALKRELGAEGLKAAEAAARVTLSPSAPKPPLVEWAMIRQAASPDLSRAPRQRELFEALVQHGGAYPSSALLSQTGAARNALRELVRRGAVRLLKRPEAAPILTARGGDQEESGRLEPFLRRAQSAVARGGTFLWRMPTAEQPDAALALARATIEGGEQALVLVPEIDEAERVAHLLRDALPAGVSVATYHSGLGRRRTTVYEAARGGRVDVLVGTRTASLLPLARPGTICVVDEPSDAHRAGPGFEGLPIHVREVALERGRIDGAAIFFLSPFPSLRLFAPKTREHLGIQVLSTRPPASWPSVRLVDMRSSGAALSSTMLEACASVVAHGGRVGVVVNRLGYATALTCNGCGTERSCPDCGLPLAPHELGGLLVCNRCGHREKVISGCRLCGSSRMSPVGLAVERVTEEISSRLDTPVGLLTANQRDLVDSSIVVGTAHCILDKRWDAVVLPDIDSFLLGVNIGAVEHAFRLVYRAAEAARTLLLVQTRQPEHYALREAVRGDYSAFAAAELPRLRSLGYPPFAHLASVTLQGPRGVVHRAVESQLRPILEPEVQMSGPVPLAHAGGTPRWRVLLRSADRSVVARAASVAARHSAQNSGLRVHLEVDPEEV